MMPLVTDIEIRHFHLFCGLGGGARGFNRGEARVGNLRARFRCLGGVDVDPASIADFSRLAGVPGTCLDLFERAQYTAFHGKEPPRDWREAAPDDIRRAAGNERPHIVFLSAPCKGASGLLSEAKSATPKYRALNALGLRGVWLMLEAWADDPPELVILENVPRVSIRARDFIDPLIALLRHAGYAVAETTHDCGVIGNLAQSRKRWLMVARHMAKVPPFLYEPAQRRLRGVGEVLDKLPLPLSGLGGPMHRMPALQWKTWVRLAFVEAGSDWRSLNKLTVADGVLSDFGIMPHHGAYGVGQWTDPACTITSRGGPSNGAFSIADPRCPDSTFHQLGVNAWDGTAGTVTGHRAPGGGRYSVADPRVAGHPKSVQLGVRGWSAPAPVIKGDVSVGTSPYVVADPRFPGPPHFNNCFRIVPWSAAAGAVTAGHGPSSGGQAVADPRSATAFGGKGKYQVATFDGQANTVIAASSTGHGACAVADPRGATFKGGRGVLGWDETARTISGESMPSNGTFAVADPRPEAFRDGKDRYKTSGHYGVLPFDAPSGAVTASGQHDNGRWSVADPRDCANPVTDDFCLPAPSDRLVCVIRALDDTWHRPFTTLELAALQSLVDPEEYLELDGLSDSAWRERIGNAVPPAAAQAIASVMGRTLLLAWSGQSFMLSSEPIWVQPIAVALSVNSGKAHG